MDIIANEGLWILNNRAFLQMVSGMKRKLSSLIVALGIGLAAGAADAACYADYKAKRDNPLKLHYGVVQISGDCSKDAARGEVAQRLGSNGWILLNVLSVFDESGLDQRRDSAGQFFLRF